MINTALGREPTAEWRKISDNNTDASDSKYFQCAILNGPIDVMATHTSIPTSFRALSRYCTSRHSPPHHSPYCEIALSTPILWMSHMWVNGWPLYFPGHNSLWYQMVGKRAKGGSVHIQPYLDSQGLERQQPLPLMVKSIWDGDSIARLQTVATADYNSTKPLPQHPPILLLLWTPPLCTAFQ